MSFLNQPLTDILIRPQRKIGEIFVKVVLSETTNDVLTITKQPVQQGASITDHAFKEPTTFQMSAYFSDNDGVDLSKIYSDLLDLQVAREPFDIITPKRVYKNVLIATLGQTTDKRTENTLAVSFTFQEIIIVKVSTTQVARAKQKSAGKTGKTENAGKKNASIIVKTVDASKILAGIGL